MKRTAKSLALGAAALALVAPFAAAGASADPYNGHGYNNYGYNDHRNDYRGSYQGNWNNRYDNNWRRGDRYDRSRFRDFDWRRDHYREPPRGYRYVRDDRGDVLLVGLLSGVILSQVFNH